MQDDNIFKEDGNDTMNADNNLLYNQFFQKNDDLSGIASILHYKNENGYKLSPNSCPSNKLIIYTSSHIQQKGFYEILYSYFAKKIDYQVIQVPIKSHTLFSRKLPQMIIGSSLFNREDLNQILIKTLFEDLNQEDKFREEICQCHDIVNKANILLEILDTSNSFLENLRNYVGKKVYGLVNMNRSYASNEFYQRDKLFDEKYQIFLGNEIKDLINTIKKAFYHIERQIKLGETSHIGR